MIRMAGGTQKPGMLGAWAQAGQKRRNWLSGQPQEQMVLEGRRGRAGKTKAIQMGQGTVGEGRVGV